MGSVYDVVAELVALFFHETLPLLGPIWSQV